MDKVPTKDELRQKWSRPEWITPVEYEQALESWHTSLTRMYKEKHEDAR